MPLATGKGKKVIGNNIRELNRYISIYVYDFYDSKDNWIVADDGMVLKKKTRHGSPTVPVVIWATPRALQITSSDRDDDDDDARYGERPKQSVAIALSTARKSKKRNRRKT